MNFSQLKLIFDSFSRSSFLVAISASTLQAGANESPRVCCVHMALVNHYAVHPRRSLSNGEPGGVRIHPRRFLSLKDKCGQPVEGDRIYLHDRRACRRTCQIVSACIIVHQDGRVNLIDRPITGGGGAIGGQFTHPNPLFARLIPKTVCISTLHLKAYCTSPTKTYTSPRMLDARP